MKSLQNFIALNKNSFRKYSIPQLTSRRVGKAAAAVERLLSARLKGTYVRLGQTAEQLRDAKETVW